MRSRNLFFLLTLALFLISIASAAPPFLTTGQTSEGYNIFVTSVEEIQINKDFIVNFHVTNVSNGYPIDNSSTVCITHLTNNNGTQIFESFVDHFASPTAINEWEISIKAGNFSYLGPISLYVECRSETDSLAGSAVVFLLITTKGYTLETSEIILYLLVLGVFIFFFLLGLYGAIKIPYKNQKNTKGEVISINWNKHFKIFCITFVYFMLLSIDWFIWNLVYAYSEWFALSNVFHYIFRMMYSIALPVVGFMFIWIIIKFKEDDKINKFMKRTGLPWSGTKG